MLRCIGRTRLASNHVNIHVVSALSAPRHYGPTSDLLFQDRFFNSSPSHAAGDDDDLVSTSTQSGTYTSLTSKLDHYPSNPDIPSLSVREAHPPLSTLIPQQSTQHSSLHTFLTHARRTALSPTSTVYLGTRYEYLTQLHLRRLGLELIRVGKRGDGGVDLLGRWWLPSQVERSVQDEEGGDGGHANVEKGQQCEEKEKRIAPPIKVLVQCKRLNKKITPAVVREMEGAFRSAPAGWRGGNVVGLVVSGKPATKGVIDGMKRSDKGLGWVCLEEVEVESAVGEYDADFVREEAERAGDAEDVIEAREREHSDTDSEPERLEYSMVRGKLRQILWNQKARELGLEGLDVVKQYAGAASNPHTDEIVLMWKGERVGDVDLNSS